MSSLYGETWIDATGKSWRPASMQYRHLRNVIAFIERNAEVFYAQNQVFEEGASGAWESDEFQAAWQLANTLEVVHLRLLVGRHERGADNYRRAALVWVRRTPLYMVLHAEFEAREERRAKIEASV